MDYPNKKHYLWREYYDKAREGGAPKDQAFRIAEARWKNNGKVPQNVDTTGLKPKGTQANHTVTSRGNSSRRAGGTGGSIGDIGGGGMNWETK